MARVIIVGAGMAGAGVARALRASRPEIEVVLVTADDGHQYPKPQLSASLRLGKQPDELITLRADGLAKLGVEVVARTPVTAIDVARRAVTLSDGRALEGTEIVLATGASPIVPPMAGVPDAALTVNHLDDYRRFRERLAPGQPVLVTGGGLVGLEFAADLASTGHAVHGVDPGPGALPRLLPAGAAALVQHALADAGARYHWGRTVTRIDGQPGAWVATLSDGQTLEVATVLSAVGLRPETALARAAGLPVGRGVQVDAFLRAAPHVYAVGDCAELPGGLYLPFIKPIGEQAKHVARTIAGETTEPYVPANYQITVKIPMWPVASTTPVPGEAGTWAEETSSTGSLSRLVAADGTVMRVVATGDRTQELRDWLPRVPLLGTREAAPKPL